MITLSYTHYLINDDLSNNACLICALTLVPLDDAYIFSQTFLHV